MSDKIKIQCIKVEQPIGLFYVRAIDAKDILAISFAESAESNSGKLKRLLGFKEI